MRAGELPLWNPWNGFGVPLMGNLQSSAFSLFQIPFYLAPIHTALLVSVCLKLLLGPWLLLGFLRQRGVSPAAATVAATGFMLGGFHLAWLFWPHSGVVGCGLMLLYFLERALAAIDWGEEVPRRWRLGIWLAAALGSTAGHPHLWILILVPALAWSFARNGLRRCALRSAFRGWIMPMLLGFLSASIVWVPFFEFLCLADLEAFHASRSAGVSPLSPVSMLLNFSPLALGNPADGSIGFNTQELLGLHTGLLIPLFALAGLALCGSRPEVRVFGGLGGLFALYGFNVGGVAGWLGALLGLSILPATRLAPVILLGVAVLTAAGVDRLQSLDGRRRFWVWLLGLALVGTFAPTAWSILIDAQPAGAETARKAAQDLMLRTGLTALGWTAAIWGASAPTPLHRCGIGLALLVMAFTQGQPFRAQWPIVPSSHNFPATPALASSRLGESGAMAADPLQCLLPSVNAIYDVPLPTVYDGLYVSATWRLIELVGGTRFGWQARAATDPFYAGLFGLDHVVTRDPVRPIRPLSAQPGRFYVAPSLLSVKSGPEALQAIRARRIDPTLSPVVVDPEGTLPAPTAAPPQVGANRVESARVGRRWIDLAVRTEQPGFLVAVMTWYPGWRAEVDDRPARLYRTNYAFLGLPIEPGSHRVRLIYDPASVRLGFWLSLFGLSGPALALFTPRKSAFRSSGSAHGNAR